MTPEEFYDERSFAYIEMDSWTVAQYKIAMKFANDYATRVELDVRKELSEQQQIPRGTK